MRRLCAGGAPRNKVSPAGDLASRAANLALSALQRLADRLLRQRRHDRVPGLVRVQPVLGRYDASAGTLLRGLGDGRFTSADQSDLGIEGEVRDMKLVRLAGGGSVIAVARNNATLLILRPEP